MFYMMLGEKGPERSQTVTELLAPAWRQEPLARRVEGRHQSFVSIRPWHRTLSRCLLWLQI